MSTLYYEGKRTTEVTGTAAAAAAALSRAFCVQTEDTSGTVLGNGTRFGGSCGSSFGTFLSSPFNCLNSSSDTVPTFTVEAAYNDFKRIMADTTNTYAKMLNDPPPDCHQNITASKN